jgi:hypothetical protein
MEKNENFLVSVFNEYFQFCSHIANVFLTICYEFKKVTVLITFIHVLAIISRLIAYVW